MIEPMEWMDNATCRTMDPDLFVGNHQGGAGERRQAKALATCDRCPVIVKCREHAIDLASKGQIAGIWGGLTAAQIHEVARARA